MKTKFVAMLAGLGGVSAQFGQGDTRGHRGQDQPIRPPGAGAAIGQPRAAGAPMGGNQGSVVGKANLGGSSFNMPQGNLPIQFDARGAPSMQQFPSFPPPQPATAGLYTVTANNYYLYENVVPTTITVADLPPVYETETVVEKAAIRGMYGEESCNTGGAAMWLERNKVCEDSMVSVEVSGYECGFARVVDPQPLCEPGAGTGSYN
eukprot:TRINITY_DN15088_c0_g1_i1.p1 TRINITY_DN15088_c0_g1~~TRINITY_DN15088_c0_g1_i1.p1  ORF type:complete len:206 (-),score=28.49 TRINITY_DN15088_c0_g1_i1:157-774(-)